MRDRSPGAERARADLRRSRIWPRLGDVEQRAHDQVLAHLEARYTVDELAMWLAAGATASEDAVIALATQPAIAQA